jgi:hypothetical protein
MKTTRPSEYEYGLARRSTRIALAFAMMAALYGAAVQSGGWIYPILVALLMRQAGQARRKIAAYEAWCAEWNEMGGGDAPPLYPPPMPPTGGPQ